MALGDRIRELDEQVAAAVRRTIDDLRDEMRRRLDEATVDLQRRLGEVAPELPQSFVSEEHLRQLAEEAATPSGAALDAARDEARREARGEARRETHGELFAALAAIDRARSQADILQSLLDATAHHARRAAVLLARDDRLAGWGARGFEAGPEAVRGLTLEADEPPWSAVAGGGAPIGVPGARCAPLVSQLDSALPNQGVLIPLVLRERVAAVLYADRPHAADALDVEALQVLTYAAALALETLALRARAATATLLPASGAVTTAAPSSDAVEETAVEPEPPEAAPEEYEEEPAAAGAAELEDVGGIEAVEEIEVEEIEIDVEPAVAEPEDEDFVAESAAEPEVVGEVELEPEIEIEDLEELEPIGLAPEAEEEDAEDEAEPEPPAEESSIYTSYGETAEAEEPAAEEPLAADAEEPAPATVPPVDEDLLTRRHDYLQAVEEADAQAAQEAGAEIEDEALEETAFEEAPELEEPAVVDEAVAEDEPGPIPWRTEARDTTAVTPPVEAEPEPEVEVELEEPAEVEEEVAAADQEVEEVEDEEEPVDEDGVPSTPKTVGAGSVQPPADVEGPGWAFSATREPVAKHEEAAHEEARRLARLLVSEIQLYNQDEVEEGRHNRDIYERLKDDIDRSRQLYEERVDPGVRETTDYFYQELVRQLAAGDAKALGI